MLYRDLVQFDPIESVIQLLEAGEESRAAELVRTFVISDRMADALSNVTLPQLQFDQPVDYRGILVVGNYGTGKSHLMSVLAAAAEYPETVKLIGNERVREAAAAIAGRFNVVRVELAGTERTLRDALLSELEKALAEWGTPFTFPAATEINRNKDSLIQAVATFREAYPDRGILLVVDELLDFLRSRPDRGLILDLSFLRELGEVTALTPFRFIGGIQETLFDNPRFNHVSDPLRRVKDRFVQLNIAREDIAFVVAERLLRKDDEQIAKISDHLRQFAPLYPGLAERLTEFARLFPIHPGYIEMFEQLYIAEKRQALVTFRDAVEVLLDQEVPEDEPGLLSYDHYWGLILNDSALRTASGVSEVVDKSKILASKVSSSFSRPALKPMAGRIIDGLSIQRLTTDDIYVPLGITPAELRDDLLLHLPLPQADPELLLDQVQVALREIMRTVSGQYISHNEENDQYYLDIKKDVDFDARIRDRAEPMDDNELNRYFYDALRQVLSLSTSTYVSGFNIWPYEIPWDDKNVTRPGYLFFGQPEDRSTAQPPRDFYIYVTPPYGQTAGQARAPEPDEVILTMSHIDQKFTELLRLYAGARALANESSSYRDIYQEKAAGREGYLRRLTDWLRNNLQSHVQVTFEGETRPLRTVLAGARSTGSQSVDELLNLVSAHLLEPYFSERYPDYPAFTTLRQPVTETSRATAAREAINLIARGTRSALGSAVLEGLELNDAEGMLRPHQSPYARRYLDMLNSKPENQVVNRTELIQVVGQGPAGPLEKDIPFSLEPEWTAVALVALVQNGDIVLSVDRGQTLDAGNLEQAAVINLADLANFRHYARTKGVPVERWVEVLEQFGLSPGLMRDETQREEGVRQLQDAVQKEAGRMATLKNRMGQPVQFWGQSLFTDRTLITEGGVVTDQSNEAEHLLRNQFDPELRLVTKTLDSLGRFNTVGKLRNLDLQYNDLEDVARARQQIDRFAQVLDLVAELQPLSGYLAQAESVLPVDHPWQEAAAAAREEIILELRRMARDKIPLNQQAITRRLTELQQSYREVYAEHHRRSVLGAGDRERVAKLRDDPRRVALQALAEVDLLKENGHALTNWQRRLDGLRVCSEFHDGILEASPLCRCGFRPDRDSTALSAAAALDDLDQKLDDLLENWQTALRTALAEPSVQASLREMTPAERKPVEAFLAQPPEETTIPSGFVRSVNRALRGIEALALPVDELLAALREGGLPCTVDELITRFGHYVGLTLQGHDKAAIRLTLGE